MTHSDRRHLAVLATAALGWGLVLAPLLHTLEHAGVQVVSSHAVTSQPIHGRGHGHSHGPSAPGQRHGERSLEHSGIFFTTPVTVLSPVLVSSLAHRAEVPRYRQPGVRVRQSPSMPQGP